ncbi:LTA synthase family protein [Vibrio viridaestus]|uniref:LTA synthase family protein n=1 Tax=Vibrio viridaestus TaxID=2487322 RepID=A0A3N9U5V1_9VIBR|nr:LTA synthase family protein [Vibrio viridaestus]RQW63436.1 LTA synthase family protein [Vibrio viridaestus]
MMKTRNYLTPLFKFLILAIVFLTLSRLGLSLWQSSRLHGTGEWMKLFIGGFRVDISTLCYLLILPALIHSVISGNHFLGKAWHYLLRIWLVAGGWLLVYMEVATVPYILEYDLRPNRIFVEYLIYPKEVSSMLWSGYKLELFIGLVVSVLTIWYLWKATGRWCRNLSYPKWYYRPFIGVILVALGVLGARNSLEHRPMNPAMVSFSTDPLVNDLALNSSYSVIFAMSQMESEASALKMYPKMDKSAVIETIREQSELQSDAFVSDKYPTLAYHQATGDKQKNIVILLLESHGAQFVSSLGGEDLSPNIDKLIHSGWAFTNLYATGTRSVRGIEAVTSGFPPTPARSTVKLGKSQNNFFTIADVLKKRGYATQFIYGGESHFDNMRRFFLGNGFNNIQDASSFKNPEFVGSWGASDGDLFNKADEQFTEFTKENKPFFSLVFTSSNHSPFEYPEGKITHVNEPAATRENAVKYSDYTIGEFFAKARKSNYWDNTVFLVIADHDARTYGDQIVPITHFHIPAVITGGGIEPRLDDRLTSQLDMPSTLLSLAGISAYTPMIGHDMTQNIPIEKQRALMQRDHTFAWMDANHDVVVYQPQKEAQTFHYDRQTKQLTEADVSQQALKDAHAFSLWGSIAYKDNLYTQLENYQKKPVAK